VYHHLSRRALACVALLITSLAAACGEDQAADDPSGRPAATTSAAGDEARGPTSTAAPAPEAVTIAVDLAGGDVVGGVRTEVVALDEAVRIEVSGDTEDDVHVHTYDLFGEVAPGEAAVIEFVADIPGIHEVELEGSHRVILELQVEP
jgi:hypothetical protein